MTGTFLHQDKSLPPDQAVDIDAPDCERCGQRMWLCKVQRTLSDKETTWRREYECKNCGEVATVQASEALRRVS